MNTYLNRVYDEVNLMIAIISNDHSLIHANKRMLDFAKVSLDEIKGIAFYDLPWWQHSAELQNKLLFAMNDSYMGQSSRFNASQLDANGDLHEIDFTIKPVMEDDEPKYYIAMGYNITELVSTQKALTERDRRLKAFFDYSIEGYFFLSLPDQVKKCDVDDQIVDEVIEHYVLEGVNDRLLEILNRSEITKDSIFEAIGIAENLKDTIKKTILDGHINLESTISINGEVRHLDVTLASIYDENEAFEGNFAIVRDITQEVNYLENIKYLANKDYLTGINNRRSFFKDGQALYDHAVEHKESLTMVMLDIDHFKRVNDYYGHDAGDVVIKEVAEAIETLVGDHGVVGRYGGEEYVAVVNMHINDVYHALESFRESIEQKKFIHDQHEINITVSAGIVNVDFKATLEANITKADIALYESKENGRNQTTIFVDKIHGKSAINENTGIFNARSIKLKLTKMLLDIKKQHQSLWMVYFELNVLEEKEYMDYLRHSKTLGLCLKHAARDKDVIGHIEDKGFVILMRQINSHEVHEAYLNVLKLIELGFSGMLYKTVEVKGACIEISDYMDYKKVINDTQKIIQAQ